MKPSSPISNEPRIEILDGFRCIAVMAVIFYHYFFFFGNDAGLSDYPVWTVATRGYFGVHLFFMISGFVIYRSMDQSNSIKEFLGKRYIRLAPSLVLASIITYCAITWWNSSDRIGMFSIDSPLDFLFSFTLIHPDIWNSILGRSDIEFIDGSYWSLWPEVVFYVSASIVYFNSRKENFLRNWFILALIVNLLRVATSPRLATFTPGFILPISSAYYRTFLILNLGYWIYFSVGILFYSLWMKRTPQRLVWVITVVLFLLEMYFIEHQIIRVLFVGAIGLWILFLFRPSWLGFLRWRSIQVIGLISYPLYLLHETAGLVLTEKLITWTNHSMPVSFLLFVAWIVLIALAYLVFTIFEKPVMRVLKTRLRRKMISSPESRIEVLDGFRCIAVLAVIAYHYLYCFGLVLEVHPTYPVWYFFAFGYFGVYLFFMISGFVIYRSLEQSESIKIFFGKRYIRLAPTLILGSIVTYALISWWNSSGRLEIFGMRSPADFLFSFTFIHPDVWNRLLGRDDITFVDGSYWSLWVEVVFYISAGIIYFSSRKENFLRNWFVIVFILNVFRIVIPPNSAYYHAFMFPGIQHWTYFSVGIFLYALWMKRTPSKVVWVLASILLVLEIYLINSNGVRLLFALVIGVWFIFLYRPWLLRFLQWKPIQVIGLISYPLYVFHFSAGVVLTEKLRVLTNNTLPVPLLLIFILAVFILLSYFVFAFFEKPITKTLKEKLGIK